MNERCPRRRSPSSKPSRRPSTRNTQPLTTRKPKPTPKAQRKPKPKPKRKPPKRFTLDYRKRQYLKGLSRASHETLRKAVAHRVYMQALGDDMRTGVGIIEEPVISCGSKGRGSLSLSLSRRSKNEKSGSYETKTDEQGHFCSWRTFSVASPLARKKWLAGQEARYGRVHHGPISQARNRKDEGRAEERRGFDRIAMRIPQAGRPPGFSVSMFSGAWMQLSKDSEESDGSGDESADSEGEADTGLTSEYSLRSNHSLGRSFEPRRKSWEYDSEGDDDCLSITSENEDLRCRNAKGDGEGRKKIHKMWRKVRKSASKATTSLYPVHGNLPSHTSQAISVHENKKSRLWRCPAAAIAEHSQIRQAGQKRSCVSNIETKSETKIKTEVSETARPSTSLGFRGRDTKEQGRAPRSTMLANANGNAIPPENNPMIIKQSVGNAHPQGTPPHPLHPHHQPTSTSPPYSNSTKPPAPHTPHTPSHTTHNQPQEPTNLPPLSPSSLNLHPLLPTTPSKPCPSGILAYTPQTLASKPLDPEALRQQCEERLDRVAREAAEETWDRIRAERVGRVCQNGNG